MEIPEKFSSMGNVLGILNALKYVTIEWLSVFFNQFDRLILQKGELEFRKKKIFFNEMSLDLIKFELVK